MTMNDTAGHPGMAPTIPPKHPRRLMSTRGMVPAAVRELSNEQTELWEHAALLYHAYEWQDSVSFRWESHS